MKTHLHYYDIYPKVVSTGDTKEITIKPLGRHAEFKPDMVYTVKVLGFNQGDPNYYTKRNNVIQYDIKVNEEKTLTFAHEFVDEQEYAVRVYLDEKLIVALSVYAVSDDLIGRYPYIGDLHMHSFRSDGKEAPEIVVANYRKFGYDFITITDHHRYYPSLEAIDAYKGIDMDYLIVTGEEVHLPGTDVHIVNFGGDYSVNAIIEGSQQSSEVGDDEKYRSNGVTPPAIIARDEYNARVDDIAKNITDTDILEKRDYAVCKWGFDQIKKANGLAIFCHPYWISNVYQVPETLTEYIMEKQEFDAFEVLGGENYFEQNGFQAIRYYEDLAKNRVYPIVGSTDSHGSVNNTNAYVARTMVFSPENSKDKLIASIKSLHSVAIDGISEMPRLIGSSRYVRYAQFLLTNYLPIHDELCFEEGRLMREYVCNNGVQRQQARDRLVQIGKQMDTLRQKYFQF